MDQECGTVGGCGGEVTSLYGLPHAEAHFLRWYSERARRCMPLMWQVIRQAVQVGREAVWEIGFVRRHERELVYNWADDAGVAVCVHVLDAPEEFRWERVRTRNAECHGSAGLLIEHGAFRRASQLWEEPGDDEVEARRAHGGVWWEMQGLRH